MLAMPDAAIGCGAGHASSLAAPQGMKRALLNLGCGGRCHDEWVNVDIRPDHPGVIALDLRQALPFDDDRFEAVYHSHVLEHLPKAYAPMLLHECFRVLCPGGYLRVVVPDLEQIARIYLEQLERSVAGDIAAQTRYDWILLEMLDQLVRNESGGEMRRFLSRDPLPEMDFILSRVGAEARTSIGPARDFTDQAQPGGGSASAVEDFEAVGEFRASGEIHQWMYDRYALHQLLRHAGFVEIQQRRADESSIPRFNDYLLDLTQEGAIRKPDSLFMEARKPLTESEVDRTARVDRFRSLNLALARSKPAPSESQSRIIDLESRLKESEADRAARLDVIHRLDGQLKELAASRARLEAEFYEAMAQLKASEADRAARLTCILDLDGKLKATLAELSKAQATLSRVENTLKERDFACATLTAEARAMSSSLSWRLTAPLRRLTSLVRRRMTTREEGH